MAYAWRRAVRAMAVTSSTTCVAFMANMFSPLLPVRAFGIFSGVIVVVNYFLVVFMMPPIVIIYENYKFVSCCCCPCGKKSQEQLDEEAKPSAEKLSFMERLFDK